MGVLLLPISLLIKSYTYIFGTSIYFLTEIPIYAYSLLLIYLLIITKRNDRYNSLQTKKLINFRVLGSVGIILVLQYIAMQISFHYIGNKGINFNPNKEFLKLVIFITCIFIHYYVVELSISASKNGISRFMLGNFIALIILLIVSYLQFFFLFFPKSFAPIVSTVAKLFEARYTRNWYDAGSYVQTVWRINGFNQESDYLAMQFFVIFTPFILASIKNKVNLFFIKSNYNPWFFYILLLFIINLLFFAQTTTGFLAILIIILFCFVFWVQQWVTIKGRIKKIIIALSFLIVAVTIVVIGSQNALIIQTLKLNLFSKLASGGSFINRAGGTIALLITWATHPIAGVGWNYHNYYMFQHIPVWATKNDEYLGVFLPQHSYPILSEVGGWLAEFGSIAVLLLILYLYQLLKSLRKLCRKNKSNPEYKEIKAFSDAAHFFVFFYLFSCLLSFPWWESIYLINFFFFVVLKRKLKTTYRFIN
ncbi:MAG: hypothetical protein ACE3JK_08385 [Sporolactobacillus sp.]